MKKTTIPLLTLLLDLIEGGETELSKQEIAAFKRKSGKIYIVVDSLQKPVDAALKEWAENFNKIQKEHISCLETIETLTAAKDDLARQLDEMTELAKMRGDEIERVNKELTRSRLPVDDGTLAAPQPKLDEKAATLIEDYGFFIPVDKLRDLHKQFDESGGDLRVSIHRTMAKASITTQGEKLDILPPNTTAAGTPNASPTPGAFILTEKEYARMQAGESLEEIRGSAKPNADDGDQKVDFTALNKPAPAPEPTPVVPKAVIKQFSILVPINRDMSHATVTSINGNWASTLPEEIRKLLPRLEFEPDTVIHHARNRLATRFLDNGSEWSLWFDSDIIAPNGNPGWYQRRSGYTHAPEFIQESALQMLTRHQGKTIVSACYVQRHPGGKLIAQPGLQPRGDRDEQICNAVKEGPSKALAQVDWVGFGCVAVHRKVFLDILDKVPGVRSSEPDKAHGFFTAFEAGPTGEDIAFCKRAADAGHPSFLDLSVHAAHIGKFAFLP